MRAGLMPPVVLATLRPADAAGARYSARRPGRTRRLDAAASLLRTAAIGLVVAGAFTAVDVRAVDAAAAAEEIVQRTNTFRKAEGLPQLQRSTLLKESARTFARYMAETGEYGHTADGRMPSERATAGGYDYCMIAENIAYQYRSTGFPSASALAEAFVEGWKGSAGHRKNMVEPAATETGVGVARGKDGRYFAVQMFGQPESAAVRFDVYNRAHTGIEYRAGGRDFSLSPREVRTHLMCRPARLSIPPPSKPEPFVAEAEDGARYTVLDDRIATMRAAGGGAR